jgi:hypothetical protein
LLNVLLIQLFLYFLRFPFLSSLISQSHFFLTKNAVKLRRGEKAVFEFDLLLPLLVEMVVFVEIVIDAHVAAEVDGWQIALQCGLLGESIKVTCAFSCVEEGVVR